MVELDGDDVVLRDSRGRTASRDIVQFVVFNDYQSDIGLLAEEVLREVPDQVVGYMQSKGIKPQPVPLMSQHTINNL